MAAIQGSDVLEASQVRIHSDAGGVVGAGFLIAADVVCTCAHVVLQALKAQGTEDAALGAAVKIDFPLLSGRPEVWATVVSWPPGEEDVALLRLDTTVEGARPAPLVDGTRVWGHTFRALGYPAGADQGKWASGTLRAGQGSGWVQMEAQEPGPTIAEGFSGAPVWDDTQDGVVGMTIAAHRGSRTAYLLPSSALIDEKILQPRCPFKGLSTFMEDDAEFFHGRDSDTDRIHTAVGKRPVTLVAGPSGCGKSSLVRAGVLSRLRDEGMCISELRAVPGVRATAVLARALIGILEPGLDEVGRLTKAEELAGILETGDDVPAELRGRILARGAGAGHVLFVDQLEEYAGAGPEAGRDLFGMLVALAGRDGSAVLRVIATARPDSLDALVTADTSDLVSDAVQFLAPLAADELARAVTAPVDAVPGVWFEPGLPERIVADAGNEPGRMPLVQFALTELWEGRTSSMLTHAAYEELGGVAGALVKYADDTIDGLTQTQQDGAQRLFVQLARPGDGDTFSRKPTRTADLAPELLDLARKLAPSKLVVLSSAPSGAEGEEIVDLAHEALIQLWPRLRQWLVDSQDFRVWQEQLRADLHRWQTQDGESARLLSGTDLAEAHRRLAEHPDDISADERVYILLSRRHSRRGARIKQAAIGALAVLTVLAVVLALSTWQSLKRTEEQLRTQAAGLLAQKAEDRPASDPATAMQLALAAWNTKQTSKTRQALLHQYVRGQYLVRSYPSVWRGRATGMDAAVDGSVLVVRSMPGGGDRETISVVTGVLQGKPRTKELSGVPEGELMTDISPDGRFFAAVPPGGGVRLWQLNGSKHPAVLALGDRDVSEKLRASLDFSSDGNRLLMMMSDRSSGCFERTQRCIRGFAEAWQIPSHSRIRVPGRLVPEDWLGTAAFTSNADTIVTTAGRDRERIELRDLTTGRLLYTSTTRENSNLRLEAGGEILVTTDKAGSGTATYSQALGRTPGRKIDLPIDGDTFPEVTSRYHYQEAGIDDGGYAEVSLSDLRTGHEYRTRIPTAGNDGVDYPRVAAVPRGGGGLTLLVPIGTALMAVRAESVGSEQIQVDVNSEGNYALSPDGRFVASITGRSLEVMEASHTRRRSVKVPDPGLYNDWTPTWTADSRRIVVWGDTRGLYRSYSVEDLNDSVPLDDAVPKAKVVDSVAALQGSEMALLTEDGKLARFDAVDTAVRFRPFLVHPSPNTTNEHRFGALFGQLIARPGHPGQIAVITRLGSTRGEVLLWDTRAPRRITMLRGPRINTPYRTESVASAIAFDPDGELLAVQNADGRVRVWDVDGKKHMARSVPHARTDRLVGFGTDDSIVTYSIVKGIQIYDLLGDGVSTALEVNDDGWLGGYVRGSQLTIYTGNEFSGTLRQTFELKPETQFRTLCAAAGRDYTAAERKLLPQGTPSKPPCS